MDDACIQLILEGRFGLGHQRANRGGQQKTPCRNPAQEGLLQPPSSSVNKLRRDRRNIIRRHRAGGVRVSFSHSSASETSFKKRSAGSRLTARNQPERERQRPCSRVSGTLRSRSWHRRTR